MALILQYTQGLLFWIIITFLLLLLFRKGKEWGKNEVYKLLFAAYIVGLCSVMLFPSMDWGIDGITGELYYDLHFPKTELRGLNLIPFKTILSELMGSNPVIGNEDRLVVSALNILGNIFLYIPIGFLLSVIIKRGNSIGIILLITFILSSSIEILQYVIGRTADVDDVLLHLLGSTVGFGISMLLTKKLRRGHA